MTKKKQTKPFKYTFGRPAFYKEEYPQLMIEYFDVDPYAITEEGKRDACDYPTLAGFCRKIGVSRSTLFKWIKAKDSDGELKYKDLVNAYLFSKDCQEDTLVINGAHGLYNPAFTGLMAKNIIEWTDKMQSNETVTVVEPTKDMDPKEATNNYRDMLDSD